ncbi:MAG: U32 family peptidase [Clostridia bacterium]|nr:U32 family peptidase [Clostridia bacterium]
MPENFKGEILSPVGSQEMLYAAVRSGADAVYLGAKDFSARRNAENFNIEELAEAIAFCHVRGVKVYLTLNILVKDNEFYDALALATDAYNLGIDGIIVQDLGLARVLHEKLPQLPLHASTQLSIHSPASLPLLKSLGFKQVVVAREMSLSQLTEFCKAANQYGITVEVFVHGALCMSVSGQCLLSAFLGSRSGNRGLCAGPCRLPFAADHGTGYDLSLKDLSLIDYIPTLYGIGVRSFKIEGRMKRPEYVAAATKACKDALVKGSADLALQNTLKNVFSRSGFTSGYLENKLGRDMFGIRTKEDVTAAKDAFPVLHELYRKEYKSVGVNITAQIQKNKPISLTLTDGNNQITATGSIPQAAKNKAISLDDAYKSLTKFGDTPYFAKDFKAELDDGLFMPSSELNALRRQACELLSLERAKITREKAKLEYSFAPFSTKCDKTPDIVIRIENESQIPKDLSGIKAVIAPLESEINPIDNTINIVDIPRGITSEKLIIDRLAKFKEKGFKNALCGNLSAVAIAKELGFNVIADTGLNIHNSEALKTAQNIGITAALVSPELTLNNIKSLNSKLPKGIVSYGYIPLMLFKNCPIKNGKDCTTCDKNGMLTDRLGTKFPVRCRLGYSELLNSVPIWLADRQKELYGIDFQVLFFTNETREDVEKVISAYKSGKPCDNNFTRGLYYKGTI